jgi:hypothetical protein
MWSGGKRAALLALVVVTACTPNATPADPRHRARDVADEYLKSRGDYSARRPVYVRDEKSEWVVVYKVPPGMAGGELWVSVDKRTMKVSGFVGWQ